MPVSTISAPEPVPRACTASGSLSRLPSPSRLSLDPTPGVVVSCPRPCSSSSRTNSEARRSFVSRASRNPSRAATFGSPVSRKFEIRASGPVTASLSMNIPSASMPSRRCISMSAWTGPLPSSVIAPPSARASRRMVSPGRAGML